MVLEPIKFYEQGTIANQKPKNFEHIQSIPVENSKF